MVKFEGDDEIGDQHFNMERVKYVDEVERRRSACRNSDDDNPSTRDAYRMDINKETYTMPLHPTLKDRIQYPVKAFSAYFNRTKHNFGRRFLALIVSTHSGVKGFLYTAIQAGQLPFYKNFLHASAETYQACVVVAATPWAMKPLIGALSDLCPIGGYHKRYYIMGAAIAGSFAFMALGLLPISTPTFAALLFFCASAELSIIDLLVEGQYAEIMSLKPSTGGDITSWVWGVYMIGSLGAAALVGTLADTFGPRVIFMCSIVLAAQVLLPIMKGWLPERRIPSSTNSKTVARVKFQEQKRLFILAGLTATGALGLAIVNLLGGPTMRLIYAIIASVILCFAGFWSLPPAVAKANVYMFCTQALYIILSGPLDYFYTAPNKADCLEANLNGTGCDCWVDDGPNFDYVLYLTTAQLLSTAAGSVGVALFQGVMGKWKFRKVFWTTTLLRCFAASFDVFISSRTNIYFNIPDKWAYFCGTAIISQVCYMLDFMPGIVLTSKLCPKGFEATVYALLAGFQNFGQNVSTSIGTFAASFAGISTRAAVDGTPIACEFGNLPYLITFCHMILPLITIPLTFVLIPDALLTDEIKGIGLVKSSRTNEASGLLESDSLITSNDDGDVRVMETIELSNLQNSSNSA